MDRPRTWPASGSDRSGVQLFLENRVPVVRPSKPLSSAQERRPTLSNGLWILDGLLVSTALSLLLISGLDRLVTLALGSWLVVLAAGVGVLAVICRR